MITKIDEDRWPITAEHRQAAVDAMMGLIHSDDTSLMLRACRLMLAMDAENRAWEKLQSESLRVQIRQVLRDRMAAG